MPSEIKGREQAKFVQSPTRADGSAIEVISNGNAFSPPAGCDFIGRSVVGSVETFLFKSGGELGSILKTVVVTYSDVKLNNLVKVEVS